jgi:hypothetical protein
MNKFILSFVIGALLVIATKSSYILGYNDGREDVVNKLSFGVENKMDRIVETDVGTVTLGQICTEYFAWIDEGNDGNVYKNTQRECDPEAYAANNYNLR